MKKSSLIVHSLLLSSCISIATATTLKEAIEDTVNQNPKVKSILLNNDAYKTYIDEAQGGYYPRIDLEVSGESRKTQEKFQQRDYIDIHQKGYNAQLRLEQLLYDGGYTPAKIDEMKFQEKINRFENEKVVDELMFETFQSYIEVVKYENRLALSSDHVTIHEEYYDTAKQNEALSDNSLDTYEVKSKLHLAKKNTLQEQDALQRVKKTFKRLTSGEIDADVCLPVLDSTKLPSNIEELTEYAIANNNTILAEMARIHKQEALLKQEDSQFLPSVKFRLVGTRDDDLLAADTKQNVYSSQIVLNYNLYNGGQDHSAKVRAKKFVKESQEIINNETNKLKEELSGLFESFELSQKMVSELKEYVSSTDEVLKLYKLQFEGGSRRFVDILDQETDLYNAKLQLIDEEVRSVELFYNMLLLTSQLQDEILSQENQICTSKYIVPRRVNDIASDNSNLDEISDLFNENKK
jgi:adhesin transport system outer membrane protein